MAAGCPTCGAANEPDDSFCGECGGALGGSAGAAAPPSGQAAGAAPPERPLPESFADGRYRVNAFLGEGARKLVYRATDTRLGREVAVAAAKIEGLDEAALARVWHEARSMARLGDHPNVVTVYDVIDDGAAPVVVSQYMAGGSLADHLEAAPDRRLTAKEAAALALDVCRALEHAHGLGIVHRDIKPANIWLDSEGRALLGDFGLALGSDGPRVTIEGMMLGTVAYMPPEQAVGREADARSDLYSLGAVLYEMVTGRPPFLGQDTVAVVSQHLNTAPVLPTWFNSEVPAALESLVMELLAKAPEQRPVSAAATAARLTTLEAAETTARVNPRVGSAGTTWRFVGREAEMSALRRAVDTAVGGRGSLVMVVGEPGIGKTRTTEQAAAYASVRGMQVLLGRCYEGDASIPYLPFIEAIRGHVLAASPDQLRSELGPGGSDVAKLVSEVRERVVDLPPAAPAEGPDQERRRLLESVTSFLVNASTATPIMVVLDDLHWADRPSLLLLRHLARHVASSRLLVVGTYRDVELDRRHPLSDILSDLRRESSFERILLRGLSTEEVLAFLEAAAEREADGPMRRLIPILHRETEGNPFFIREVLLHMAFTGQFVRRNDRWELAQPDLAELGIPEGVREVIGRRLSRLSEEANSALADAAVLGREFEFPVLARMQGVAEDALLGVIEEALVSQLIVERPGGTVPTYAFSHALVRETLYEELSLPRKQRKHLLAGQALEAVHIRDRDRVVPVLASHFRQAGAAADPAVTLGYAQSAADAAMRVFAWEDAISHLETALEVMEESGAPAEERAALATRLGDLIFVFATLQARGIAHLERALELYEQIGNERRAAQVHARLGRSLSAYASSAEFSRALPHLRAAEKVLADGTDRAALVYLHQSIATAGFWAGNWEDGAASATEALEMARRLGDERAVASSESLLAMNMLGTGRLDAAFELVDRARDHNDRLGQHYGRWIAVTTGEQWRYLYGDVAGAEANIREELTRLERAASPVPRDALYMGLSHCLIAAGRLDEAEEALQQFGADPAGMPLYLLARGRFEEALRCARQGAEDNERRGARWQAWWDVRSMGTALGLLGRHEEALDVLEPWSGVSASADLLILALMATLAADAGRSDAGQFLDRMAGLPVLGQNLLGASATVARARGAVAAQRGEHDAAVAQFSEAIEVSTRHGAFLDAADGLTRRARSHAVVGRVADALADLSSALAVYEKAGAGPAWTDPLVAARVAVQGAPATGTDASIAVVAASVASEQPDLASHAAGDGTVTLVFTDLGNSTSLNEQLGDRAWFKVLQTHHDLVRTLVERHGGSTVKSQGDGFMLAFPSARRAIECSRAIQRAASAQRAGDRPLSVRIGIHTGDVLRQGEDFFGRHVNLAARVASAAQPGEILVSSLVRGLVSGDKDLCFDGPRSVELKGFDQPEPVYRVITDPLNE